MSVSVSGHDIFRSKWKPRVLVAILKRKYRFNKIKLSLKSISSRTLSRCLARLIEINLIEKIGDDYFLTSVGSQIAEHLAHIYDIIERPL